MRCFPGSRFLQAMAAALTIQLAAGEAREHLDKPERWFRSDEGREVIERMLSWQSRDGSWPKNKDTTRVEFRGRQSEIRGTFDNRATTDELRLLARGCSATGEKSWLRALEKGVELVLKAQYRNGGWPQTYPLERGYSRHITFNDGSMVRLMRFVREVAEDEHFEVLDEKTREKAAEAFERGVECILACQIRVDGEATVWCAQHDERTLEPAKARSYELPSFSGAESSGVLRLLMSIERPSREVVKAVEGGIDWYERSKIEGIRVERKDGNKVVVEDRSAPPLWARFYDLETGKPFFCDRDGEKKDQLSEIGHERRNGYAWYGNWGRSLEREFDRWR